MKLNFKLLCKREEENSSSETGPQHTRKRGRQEDRVVSASGIQEERVESAPKRTRPNQINLVQIPAPLPVPLIPAAQVNRPNVTGNKCLSSNPFLKLKYPF